MFILKYYETIIKGYFLYNVVATNTFALLKTLYTQLLFPD